jgi:hypothetical protein
MSFRTNEMKKTIKTVVCIRSKFIWAKKNTIYNVVGESENEYQIMHYDVLMESFLYPWVNKINFKILKENDNI